jgi:hypothetical protein
VISRAQELGTHRLPRLHLPGFGDIATYGPAHKCADTDERQGKHDKQDSSFHRKGSSPDYRQRIARRDATEHSVAAEKSEKREAVRESSFQRRQLLPGQQKGRQRNAPPAG